jgi:hypothetical protein
LHKREEKGGRMEGEGENRGREKEEEERTHHKMELIVVCIFNAARIFGISPGDHLGQNFPPQGRREGEWREGRRGEQREKEEERTHHKLSQMELIAVCIFSAA